MKAFKAYSHFVCLNSKVNGELPGKSDSHSKAKIPDHTDSLLQQRKRIVQKGKKKKKSEEENYCQSTTRKDFRKSMKASRQKYYSFRIHVENNERPKNRQIDRCTTKRFLTDSTMILQTKRLLFTLSNSYCLSARANNTPTDYCL